MAEAKVITIKHDRNSRHGSYLRVTCDDRYELCTEDEALYVVACLLIRGFDNPAPYLRTQAEHDAARAMYAPSPPLQPHERQLPLPQETST